MSERITAVLDQIEAEQRQTSDTIPDNISIAELAEQVVRGKAKLTLMQLRVLIELLPFHMPRRLVSANLQVRILQLASTGQWSAANVCAF